jgi:hypothetical protein
MIERLMNEFIIFQKCPTGDHIMNTDLNPDIDHSNSIIHVKHNNLIALPPPPNANGCTDRSVPEYVSNGQCSSCMNECLCPWYGSDQSEGEEDREPDMNAVSRFVDGLTGNWDWGELGGDWD